MPQYCPACAAELIEGVPLGKSVRCPECRERIVPDPPGSPRPCVWPSTFGRNAVLPIPMAVRQSGTILLATLFLGGLVVVIEPNTGQVVLPVAWVIQYVAGAPLFFKIDVLKYPGIRNWLIPATLVAATLMACLPCMEFLTPSIFHRYAVLWILWAPTVFASALLIALHVASTFFPVED